MADCIGYTLFTIKMLFYVAHELVLFGKQQPADCKTSQGRGIRHWGLHTFGEGKQSCLHVYILHVKKVQLNEQTRCVCKRWNGRKKQVASVSWGGVPQLFGEVECCGMCGTPPPFQNALETLCLTT